MVVVAIAAAVALAQLYQAEKARGANERRLRELQADFDRLVPPEYNLSPMDPPAFIKQSVPEPSFNMADVTPEQFKLIGKYTPQIAAKVAEQRPELLKESAAAKEGRSAQMNALQRLKAISQQESDPELAQALANANRQAQIQAQSRQQSILQDMARRGGLTSGMGVAAQLQSSSDAMERHAMQSQAAAAEQYRNRLAALRDSATLGGQIRGDEMAMEGRNVDIINDFNARTARSAQDWQNRRADVLNDAQRQNLAAEQRVADANVDTRNKYAQAQQERRDQLLRYLDQRRMGERAYQNDLTQREADWRRGERDNQNALKSRMYGDALQRMQGKHGMVGEYNALETQRAQDRNAAIQGFGNAAAGAYQAGVQRDESNAAQDRADRRAYFEKTGYWDDDERRRAGGY